MEFNFWETVKTSFTFALVFYIFGHVTRLLDLVFTVIYGGK
jgi:hypothetical protein